MISFADDPIKEEVWRVVRAINDSWTRGDPHALRNYFHPNMVAITATDRDRLEGREACLQSWLNFTQTATIGEWKELDPKIQIYGDTAIVTYYFDMSFDVGNQPMRLGGRDMFVLVKQEDKWWAVADQFSPYPAV